MYHKYQNIIKLKWEHLEITIKEEDLEAMTETIKEINQQKDGSYLVDPRISIRELNKALKIKLPYDSAKTLNGLILENLQSFPQHNVSLKIEPLIIEIVQVSKQGVKLVKINKIY